MSLIVKIIKRHQPGVKGGGEASYSGAIECKETITEMEFVQMYMKKIRTSEAQAVFCCLNFQQLLSELLCDSKNVQFSMLGTVSANIKSETVKYRKDFKLDHIKSVGVHLRANSRFKEKILNSLKLIR